MLKSLLALCLVLTSANANSPELVMVMVMQKMKPEQLFARHATKVMTGRKIEINYLRANM